MNELIPRAAIEETVAHRNRALELYRAAFDKIAAADAAVRAAEAQVALACAGTGEGYRSYVDRHLPEIAEFDSAVKLPDGETYMQVAERLTDLRVWASLIERTNLETLMDREAKTQLRAQMSWVAPPRYHAREVARGDEQRLPAVTVETIYQTLSGFAEQSGAIFRRGLANAFANLDRRFRSHDGFKIGSRVILSYAFDGFGSWNYHRHHRDTLQDIERVFLVLDGKSPRAPYGGIVGAVDHARKSGGVRKTEHEGDYFRVRVFKNGNAHLWFTRDDLVKKANLLLAEHFGEVVADGKDRPEDPNESLDRRAVGHARNLGWFPTPDKVADEVVEKLTAYPHRDIIGKSLLEPSAGEGALARRAAKAGALVDVVELDAGRATKLRAGGLRAVTCGDFLELAPEERRQYDFVAMNPPFDRGRDIDHVWHAWKFLRPGGRLVAVMSASSEFSESAKAVAFRSEMERVKARWSDLPAGSFAPDTWVNARILVADKMVG